MGIRVRRCLDCDQRYDVLEYSGWTSSLDNDDIDDLSCPACGGEAYCGVIEAGTGIMLGDVAGAGKHWPKWNHSLGCMVNSKVHRDWLMSHNPDGSSRDIELVPIEEHYDFGSDVSHQDSRTEQAKERHAAQMEEYRHFGDTRKALDELEAGLPAQKKAILARES